MVRPATYDDIPAIVDMGVSFHAASPIQAPYDPAASAEFAKRLIDAPEGAVFVSDRGMIGGMMAPAYCAPGWIMAVELFWWSEDRSGLALLSEFEKWAQAGGASEVRMTTLHGLEAADKILSRKKYAPVETSYVKVI